jgi:hypothetical protein
MLQTKLVQKIKTNILCSITFSRKSCRLWDNVEKYGTARQDTGDNIIRRMRFACWITKATDTHSEYVIHIALSRQQWLRERASMLPYRYIVCFGLCCHVVETIRIVVICGSRVWIPLWAWTSISVVLFCLLILNTVTVRRVVRVSCVVAYDTFYKPEGRGFDSQ